MTTRKTRCPLWMVLLAACSGGTPQEIDVDTHQDACVTCTGDGGLLEPLDATMPPEEEDDLADIGKGVMDAGMTPAMPDAAMPDAAVPDAATEVEPCRSSRALTRTDEKGRERFYGEDVDCDGVADRGCRGVEYDDATGTAHAWEDDDCDETHERCTDGESNAYGEVTRLELHDPCSAPAPTSCQVNTYDVYGALTQRIMSLEGCMTAESECRVTIYDPPGTRGTPARSFIDMGCDGTPDRDCVVRTDHRTAQLKYPVVIAQDDDCDGVNERGCWLEETTAAGAPLTTAIDQDCDGVGDQKCEAWVYDDEGRPTLHQLDTWCDGTRVAYERTTYAPAGHADRVETLALTSSGTRCTTAFFNASGNEVRSEFTVDCSGEPSACTTFEYDAAGQRVREVEAAPCDAAPSRCTEYTYDARGNTTLREVTDCQGTAEGCAIWVYDAADQLLHAESGLSCEGTGRGCADYTYDSEGRVLSELRGTCDAPPNQCLYRTYPGPGPLDVTSYTGCDDTKIFCREDAYSADGGYRSSRMDEDCDGTFDRCSFSRLALVPGDPAFGLSESFDRDDPECTGFLLDD